MFVGPPSDSAKFLVTYNLERKRTWWLTFKESWQLLRLMFSPVRSKPARTYDLLSTHNNLGDRTRFLNLGYWESARDYDGACEALADLVADAAKISAEDDVLDVGCGLGDGANRWIETRECRQITAINITASQIEIAKQRFRHERLQFTTASATSLPFDDASFDKIIGLESAFHFDTRDAFFAQAHRVLRPGGLLTLADPVPTAVQPPLLYRMLSFLGRGFWQTPTANLYQRDEYVRRLEAAGFVDVQVRDITPHVFAPFKHYAQKRVEDPVVAARLHPWIRAMWGAPHKGMSLLEYLIITARK